MCIIVSLILALFLISRMLDNLRIIKQKNVYLKSSMSRGENKTLKISDTILSKTNIDYHGVS